MCGIYGFSSLKSKSLEVLFNGLRNLQHRGQDGYGVACEDYYVRQLGKVPLITKHIEKNINKAIGHVRYTTSGNHDIKYLQPLQNENIFLVHNGNIPNLKDKHDTTYLLNLINTSSIEESLINIMETIPSAYSIMVSTHKYIYVMRDRYGIRPLYYKTNNKTIYVSSETCVWDNMENVKEIEPGTIYRIYKNEIELIYKYEKTNNSLCILELLYLMNGKSFYKNKTVNDIRYNLGTILAKKETLKFDNDYIVVGIPSSGIKAALGYADTLNIPYQQLINLQTNDRTFITLEHYRKNICQKKFLLSDKIKGKKLIIIDDTIVRGTVIKEIIKQLHEKGVKEIHVRIPAPEVIDINEYGISINDKNSLLMNKYSIDNVCNYLNINSIKFLSIEDIKKNKDLPEKAYMKIFGIDL